MSARPGRAEEAVAPAPGPEAGIAFVLGAQPYPAVPRVLLSTSAVDVQPGADR